MQKERFAAYNYYQRSEQRIAQLQAMLEYTYNSRRFWLKMFWLQLITVYLILMFS